MALKGTFHDLSLIDLLQLLNFSRKSGSLKIRNHEGSKEILLVHGDILYRDVAGGKPEADPLHGIKRFKTELLNLFLLEESSSFVFEISEPPHDVASTVKIPNLILEGCRKITNWEAIKKRIPSLDIVFRPAPAMTQNPSEIGLSPEEIQVLSAVDGKKNIRELAGELHLDQMQTASILFNLLSVSLVEKQEFGATAPHEALRFDQLAGPQKRFLEAVDAFRAAAPHQPTHETISALALLINHQVQELLSLTPPLIFDLQKVLEEISLSNPMAALIEVTDSRINTSDLLHSIKHIITGKKEDEIEAEIVDIFYRVLYRLSLFLFASLNEEDRELGVTVMDMLHVALKKGSDL